MREIARRAGAAGAAARSGSPATASCARRSPDAPLHALAGSAAHAGLRRCRRRRSSPSSSARSSPPGAVHVRAARVGGRRAGALPTPTSSRALYAAYRRRLERLGRADRRATRGRRSTRCAPPGRVGRAAGVPLRLRRPHADRARRGRDARAPRGPTCASRCRTSRGARARRPRGDRRGAAPARRARSCTCRSAPSTTRRRARPALHHLERSLFEPGARGGRRTARAVARGRRRARRGRARRRRGARADARRGSSRPTSRCVSAATPAPRRCSPGARRLRHPGAARRRVTLAAHALGAGVLAAARAALPGGTAGDLLTWLRTPGRLADGPALADALEARLRRGRASAAPPPRARAGRRPLAAGRRSTRLDALAGGGRGRPGRAARAALEAEARRSGPRRTAARAVLAAEDLADARVAADLRAAAAGAARRSPRRIGIARCSAPPP